MIILSQPKEVDTNIDRSLWGELESEEEEEEEEEEEDEEDEVCNYMVVIYLEISVCISHLFVIFKMEFCNLEIFNYILYNSGLCEHL